MTGIGDAQTLAGRCLTESLPVTDQEIFNAQQRIAALERKVAELYGRIGQAERAA
jgi:hypothetical protein